MRPHCTPADGPRFWAWVQKGGGCWLWTGAKNWKGYGAFTIGSKKEGTKHPIGAHRAAWELTFGPIPAGLQVLHRCDNPSCVRPDHLFLGTPADNSADMVNKGRNREPNRQAGQSRLGERNGNARLDASTVLRIRAERSEGVAASELALKYGMTRQAIWQILTRRTWRHV